MKYQVVFMVEAYPNDNSINDYLSKPDDIMEVFNKYSKAEDKEYSQTNIHRMEWESVVVVEAENKEEVDKIAEKIKEELESEENGFQVDIFDISEF